MTAVVGRRVLGVPTVFGSRYGVPLPTDSGPARSGWFERVAAGIRGLVGSKIEGALWMGGGGNETGTLVPPT